MNREAYGPVLTAIPLYCSEEVLLGVWLVSVVWRGVVRLMKSVAFHMHCCARLIVHVQLVPYVDL